MQQAFDIGKIIIGMKLTKKKKLSRMLWIILSVILLLIIAGVVFINQPQFGKNPGVERLERIKNSPHYRDGEFQNIHETPQLTLDKGRISSMLDFLTRDNEQLLPHPDLLPIKTDIKNLDRNENVLIWFGHSSYLIQQEAKRMLVDPVFYNASPVSFVNKAFNGVNIYKPGDMPDIDYLIISHDHWDHLDYRTVTELKPRVRKVICPLGVGEHFEFWGYDKDKIIELDWYEDTDLDSGFHVYCLPARHFSGRGLSPNQTLWASFLLQTPSEKIYVGGDSGYDTHYKEIGEKFGKIDLSILENGQYNEGWKYIHIMPDELAKAAKELNIGKLFTVHNSKYALAYHKWNEPLNKIYEAAQRNSINLITPRIGEIVYLNDSTQVFTRWWELPK